jgi:hypothetical protein
VIGKTVTTVKLTTWVIYNSPADLPGRFVARKWLLDQPTPELHQGMTLDQVRDKLPHGLVRIERDPSDDSKIVESWI